MKKIISIALALVVLMACKKDVVEPTVESTSLKITVLDDTGNKISNASVKLFETENDYLSETNQVSNTMTTNSSGEVLFDNLSNKKYYWHIEKDCLNNVNTAYTSASVLQLNKANTINTIVKENGDLEIVNTTSDTYKVYINNEELGDISGNSTEYLYYIDNGTYSIQIIQQDGYILTPTNVTSTFNISCGVNIVSI